MAEPLDNIIFVGFPIPDKDTPEGASAYRHIMDAANVNKDKIFFYPENTSIPDIIRNTFTLDQSEKYNYRIGNTLCIGSDDVEVTYRHKLELLDKKVEIPVKTGYEHVDLSTMTEAEISHWLTTGSYKKIYTEQKNEDDILANLLTGDFELEGDDTTDTRNTETDKEKVMTREQMEKEGIRMDPEDEELEYHSAFQQDPKDEIDFDELMGSVDENNNEVTSYIEEGSPDLPDSPGPEDTPRTQTTDDVKEPSDNEVMSDDEFDDLFKEVEDDSTVAQTPVTVDTVERRPDPVNTQEDKPQEMDNSIDDLFDDDLFNDLPSEREEVQEDPRSNPEPLRQEPLRQEPPQKPSPQRVQEEPEKNILDDLFDEAEIPEPESEGVSRPSSDIGSFDDDDHTYRTHDEPEGRDNLDKEEEIPIDDIDIPDDDMEYVRRAERNRIRAEKREEENRRRREELDRLAAEEQGIGLHDEFVRDELGEASNQMRQRAEHTAESGYTSDGRKKNYRDYLTEEEAKSQRIAESTRAKFGTFDIDYDEDAKEGDLKYVGEGTGRIILCTSGKGGVGKSLVANGLAMALSLARAKERQTNPGANTARTWLIESDYNSPHLAMAFKTGKKNIGNIAELIAGKGKAVDRSMVRKAIEENVYVDKDTGIHVLACPPLSSRKSSKEIPFAILMAVKYASDSGDDVIIDHGNLTSGEYSELDQVLSLQLAHRVVMVSNMGCIPETQSALQILCDRERNSVVPARPVPSVSVVLNSARKEQFHIAQDKLRPFEIINILPPIDAFRAENSLEGSSYLPDSPKEVQKAVMDRCGIMLTKLGYESMRKYFSIKSSFNTSKKSESNNIIKRLADFLTGSK